MYAPDHGMRCVCTEYVTDDKEVESESVKPLIAVSWRVYIACLSYPPTEPATARVGTGAANPGIGEPYLDTNSCSWALLLYCEGCACVNQLVPRRRRTYTR